MVVRIRNSVVFFLLNLSILSAATIHLALGQHKKAELLYRDLISRNTENYGYLEGLEKSLNLKTPEERLALYAELITEYPRSHCIKRMPLLISTGESYLAKYSHCERKINVLIWYHALGDSGHMFRDVLDPFLRVSLHKGIPSLFIGLRPFYKDPEKVCFNFSCFLSSNLTDFIHFQQTKIIGELLDGYVDSLKTCQKFHPDGKRLNSWCYWVLLVHKSQLYLLLCKLC